MTTIEEPRMIRREDPAAGAARILLVRPEVRNAQSSDPLTASDVNGLEYTTHAWELGARKAKQLLFTGRSVTATEAHSVGMGNYVVDSGALELFTTQLATQIAAGPPFGLWLAKESVNRSLDAQGQSVTMDSAFALHNFEHADNIARYGQILDPTGADLVRNEAKNAKVASA